jgi:AraC-like DNA-binding protein
MCSNQKQSILVNRFLNLVQENFREQRKQDFMPTAMPYAKVPVESDQGQQRLFRKRMIDNHVIFEAKTLLKSTNMTIQQISDELNFPSQSFFGKYFKRVVGMAPKEYRER